MREKRKRKEKFRQRRKGRKEKFRQRTKGRKEKFRQHIQSFDENCSISSHRPDKSVVREHKDNIRRLFVI